MPLWWRGEIVGTISRPEEPYVDEQGKVRKYERPAGARNVLDVHPSVTDRLDDTDTRLWITEGTKKGDALASVGEVAIALQGTWSWMSHKEPLPKLATINMDGREVILGFDNDVMLKENVHCALTRLSDYVKKKGGRVKYLYLPLDDGTKVGIDDYLAQGHTLDDLLRRVRDRIKPFGPLVIAAHTIERRALTWFWAPYITTGSLASIDGDGGTGKSLVLMDLIARLTTDRPMPYNPARTLPPGERALVLGSEDDLATVGIGRLEAAGADLTKVTFLHEGHDLMSPALEDAIDLYAPRLVVVDPLQEFVPPDVNMNKQEEVRRVIKHLRHLAQQYHCVFLFVRHFGKAEQALSQNRATGSVDWTNGMRSTLQVDRVQGADRVYKLSHGKTNTRRGATMSYRVIPSDEDDIIATIEWLPLEVPHTGQRGPAPEKQAGARNFLMTELAEGKSAEKERLVARAREQDIRQRTLETAFHDLGGISELTEAWS